MNAPNQLYAPCLTGVGRQRWCDGDRKLGVCGRSWQRTLARLAGPRRSGRRGGAAGGPAAPPPMPSGDRRSITVRVRLTEAQASALVEVELERGLTTRDVLLAGVAALTGREGGRARSPRVAPPLAGG